MTYTHANKIFIYFVINTHKTKIRYQKIKARTFGSDLKQAQNDYQRLLLQKKIYFFFLYDYYKIFLKQKL